MSARYLAHGADAAGPGGQWLTGGAGIGAVLGTEALEASAGLDFRVEYFRAHAEDALGRSYSDSRPLSGLGFGVNGAWMPTPQLGFYVGGEIAAMFSHTTLHVEGQPPLVDESVRLSADAGVRLKLW